MITRILDWYFSTDNPNVAAVREFVRQHRVLRAAARALWRATYGATGFLRLVVGYLRLAVRFLRLAVVHPRAALHLTQAWFFPVFNFKSRAIMRARAMGGSLSASELGDLWTAARRSRHILCIAAEPEFRQMADLLGTVKRFASIKWVDPFQGKAQMPPGSEGPYDLTVIAGCFDSEPPIAGSIASSTILRFGRTTPPAAWGYRPDFAGAPLRSGGRGHALGLSEKLRHGKPISVLLLNDIGFQYGAGIALQRQAASLLLNGWDVRVAALHPGSGGGEPSATGFLKFTNWQGVTRLGGNARSRPNRGPHSMSSIANEIDAWTSDLIITGNLHGTDWPIEFLTRLRQSCPAVFAYMHDTYWVTGRCAQPGTCTLFRTGCTPACPTPHEYPRLAPDKIPAAWAERNKLFTGPSSIPLIANSRWTQGMVRQRFGDAARSEVVHLALDHYLFSPIPKAEARRLLGLPEDKMLLVMGAVDVLDRWKGGPLFHGVHEAMTGRDDVGVVLFGQSSRQLAATKAFGLVDDERFIPLILSACDIFVSCAIAESFGQTLLEASACGLPVVTFNVGGVSDIVVHEETGLLVKQLAIEPMLAALEQLIRDPSMRQTLGARGRQRVVERFTLTHQARAWVDCIQRLC